MDWTGTLKTAISELVSDTDISAQFTKALKYSYVFDFLQEEECAKPQYYEFKY